jgi:colanic acid biosynthesis glycosyl transferase WcaI
MRVLVYGMNYSPEPVGIGKYTAEMAEWLAERGHAVRVVAAPPYYPEWKVGAGYRGWGYGRESIRGVDVFRCPLWVPENPERPVRLLHFLSFAVSSFPVVVAQAFWRPDVVFAVEPTLFCAPCALVTARLANAKAWLHVQDYEVEAFFGLGFMPGGPVKKWVTAVEGWLMRRFDTVSSISRRMIERLSGLGVADSRTALFPNWVDTERFRPGVGGRDFRGEWGLAPDKKIVLYAGSMGRKQGLELVLETAAAVREECPEAVFLMVGDGSAKGDLEEMAGKIGLRNVVFKPPQPPEDFPALLASAHVHLVVQKKGVADAFMPSKLAGILAAGGTAIVTADAETELGRLASEHPGIAVLVSPEDPPLFRKALLSSLSGAGPASGAAENRVAREYAERYLSKNIVLSEFEGMLSLGKAS